jgi:serine/threonine-protein kinase HipA
LSTAPEADVALILKRALFAWLIADGDMHLKNMALLKITSPGDDKFSSVRMAALYDPVTTRAFPNLKRDRMALKLNGKDDSLRRADFQTFARTARLKVADADAIVDRMIEDLSKAVEIIALPVLPEYGPNGRKLAEDMLEISRAQLSSFK